MLKKIRNLFLFLLLIIGVGAYFGYDYLWQGTKQSLIPSMIPEDAVFVIEGENLVEAFDHLSEEEAISSLMKHKVYQAYAQQGVVLDGLLKNKESSVRKLLLDKEAFASFHITLDRKLFPVVYIPVKGSEIDILKELYAENLGNSDEDYEGTTIYHPSHELAVNFLLEDGVLVASRSNELLKKVIDVRKNKNSITKAHYEYLLKNETVVDGFHVYVNYSRLPNLFQSDMKDPLLKKIQTFCDFSYLDVNVKKEEIHLNGKSYASDSSITFVSCFEGQQPQQLAFSDLISNRSAFLYFWGFDKATILRDEFKKYWFDHQPDILKEWDNVKKYLKIDLEEFYGFIGDQVGLAVLNNPKEDEKLLYVKTLGNGQTEGKFQELAESILKNGNKLKVEEYVGYRITQIEIEELPYLFFGAQFKGFEQSFYTIIDDFVILGNSVSVVKKLINDIESEEVWGKTISQNAFMEKDFIESNISLFVNTTNTWEILIEYASKDWKNVLKQHGKIYQTIEQAGVQFSYKEDILYTDIVLKITSTNGEDEEIAETQEIPHLEKQLYAYEFESEIISDPYVVRSHIDNSREVFLQTADHKVHLISGDGKLLWSKALDTAIISEVKQVDVYKNNKLQYIFATPKAIHCIDRLGNDVEYYPVSLPNDKAFIHQFNVIDYDDSKNYRVISSTGSGDTYMFNIEGKNLEGWDPLKIDGIQVCPPEHVRISGKDFIVILQQKGKLNLLNRRGEDMKHFPKQLGGACQTPWFFEDGRNLKKSYMEVFAETGDVYRFNFKGKLDNTFMIPKTDMTRLELVKSPSGRSFVLVELLPNKVKVFDSDKKVLFDKQMPLAISSEVQLYNIKGKKVVVLTNPEEGKTYFLKSDGTIMTEPIESNKKIRLLYYSSTNSINIYKVYNRTISLNTIFLDK